jgi:hypothetical protein
MSLLDTPEKERGGVAPWRHPGLTPSFRASRFKVQNALYQNLRSLSHEG